MARINVEDSIWRSTRFQDLIIKLGNRHMAKGMILEFWAAAQEHWFPKRQLIPIEEFDRLGLRPLVEVGLAELRPSGVYAKGSEESFKWLFDCQEAGRKSSKSKRKVPQGTIRVPSTYQEGSSTSFSSSSSKENTILPIAQKERVLAIASGAFGGNEFPSGGSGAV